MADCATTGWSRSCPPSVLLDTRAHFHGQVDATVFTPWHGVLFGGVLLVGVFLVGSAGRNRGRGYPWGPAVPAGYDLSLLGVLLFVTAGPCDLIWHTLFGIEVGFSALVSPTHLMMVLAGVLIASGPLRAAKHRLAPRLGHGWIALAPALIAATNVLGLLTIFTAYAHPLVATYAAQASFPLGELASLTEPLGIASVILQSAIQMGVLLVLIRSWRLPAGALTLLIAISSLEVIVLSDAYGFVPGVLLAALITDALCQLLRPSAARPARLSLFAFSVPVAFYALYFATLQVGHGVAWSFHVLAGSVFLAGMTGLLVGYLAVPPVRAHTIDRATG